MFERLQLPDVASVARRTMVGALVVGVCGLVVALLFSQPWVALGLCIGLGLGMANFRLIVHSVIRVGRRMSGSKRRPLAMNTLSRLMLMTLVALVLLWFVPPLGLGIVGGLAIFQVLLLVNVVRAMLKAGAGGSGGGASLLLGAMAGGAAFEDDDEPIATAPAPAPGELPAADDADREGWGAA